MNETEILNELKEIKKMLRGHNDNLMALVMGSLEIEPITRDLKEIKNKLR